MSLSERWSGRWFRPARQSDLDRAPVTSTAVVFSGGSVFGAAQVGQLRALLEAGVVPDILVGCSVGALNAVFMAVQPDLDRLAALEEVWLSLRSRDIFDFRSVRTLAAVLRGADHLCRPDGLRDLIARFCPVDDLSDTAVHLEVVTTDLDRSRSHWWSAGPAADILLASAALPGIFPTVELDGRRHVDGGVLIPVPTARAFELGATDVYVCDVSTRGRPQLPARLGALSTLLEAFNAARVAGCGEPVAESGQTLTVLPAPDMDGISMLDFTCTDRLMHDAYELATDVLAKPAITFTASVAELAVAG